MKKLLKLWVKQNQMKQELKERVQNALHNENGQGMVEYGLIIALISVVVIVVLTGIGTKLLAKFTEIESQL